MIKNVIEQMEPLDEKLYEKIRYILLKSSDDISDKISYKSKELLEILNSKVKNASTEAPNEKTDQNKEQESP